MANFCSLRVGKLKASALKSAGTHNMRLEGSNEPNIDSSKTHLNQSLIMNIDGLTLEELVNNRIDEMGVTGIKKNSTRALEIVVSATPTYFRENADDYGVYDAQKLADWRYETMSWLQDKYGDNLVQAELHLDEKTPHIHCVVVPIVEKELKHRRTKAQIAQGEPATTYTANRLDADSMTKKKHLVELQDEYGKAVEHLGIQRGLKGSKAKHQELKDYGKKLMSETADQVHPNALKTMPVPPPVKGMKVNDYVQKLQQRVAKFYDKRMNYLMSIIEHLKTENNDLKMQLNTEKDRTALYASETHSPDEIDQLVQRAAERVRDAENRSEELSGVIKEQDDKIEELETLVELREQQISQLPEQQRQPPAVIHEISL